MTAITNTTNIRIGRRVAVGFAAALGAIGLGAVPAAADAPAEFSFSVTFSDVNPCTGADHDVTLNLDVREHVHGDRVVAHESRTGTTSDGYVMENGQKNFVFNGNVARAAFHDTWRDDSGSIFKAQGHFVEKIDGIVVDDFRLRCVKP
jgi:hypothetical protein